MTALNPVLSRPLPLWMVTLLGLMVGWVTSRLLEMPNSAPHQEVTLASVAFAWIAALSLAFFDQAAQRLGGLLLALLVTLAAVGFGPQVDSSESSFVLLGLTLGGAFLLSALRAEERKLGWNRDDIPTFLVGSVLVFVVAGLLGGMFFALVQLAGALFQAVGLEALQRWLGKSYVSVPLIVGAAAFFVGALRAQHWGQNLTRTLAQLLGYLLPVASLITAGFAFLLPIAALQDSGKLYQGFLNSGLYLTLTGVTFLLILFAFHTRPAALPAPLQTFVRLSAYLLPVYPLLALYGLSVRVQQYGLTDSRVTAQAVAVWLLITTLALALTRWKPPFDHLSRAVALGSAVMFTLSLLLGLPGLHPAQIGLRSQMARIQNPATSQPQRAESLMYLKTNSEASRDALRRMSTAGLDAESQRLVNDARHLDPYTFRTRYIDPSSGSAPRMTYSVSLLAGSVDVPPKLRDTLHTWAAGGQREGMPSRCLPQSQNLCTLYAFVQRTPQGYRVLIPANYEPGRGEWATFDGQGQPLERGTYLNPAGSVPSATQNAFTPHMPEKAVSVQKIHTSSGDIYLLPK